MAVEHEGLAAAGTLEYGDGLEATGFDFLQVDFVAAFREEVGEEAGGVGLLPLEAGDADEVSGEGQHPVLVDGGKDVCGVGG